MQKTDRGFRKYVCVTMMSEVRVRGYQLLHFVWMHVYAESCKGENIRVTR